MSSGALLGAEAERRQLTVMYCDLVGSTELSRAVDAEDMRALVKSYQRTAVTEIERYGGHVAQYLGDGILVYFGYPHAYEDGPSRAVGAALAIVESMAALSAELQNTRAVRLHVRIGLHTGVVVIGEMGSGGHTEHLAIGDAPIIAARIQAKAGLNQVLISAATAKLAQQRYISVTMGDFELKGISHPMTLHRVTGERDLGVYLHQQVGAQVDRAGELSSMLAAWRLAAGGAGRTVLLTGEAGIGKSSLLEFLHRNLDTTSYRRLEMRFSAHHRQSAYYAFAENVRRACRFEIDDDIARRIAKLTRALDELGPELSTHFGVYASLLGLQLPPEMPAAPSTKPQTDQALEHWVTAHASDTPLLVQAEDLHWADPSSLAVLARLTNQIHEHRILLLLTARPDFEPPWISGDRIVHLSVGRLGQEHIAEIIGNIARGERIPESVMEAMLDRVDGVPIFAEELTKTLLDSRVSAGEESPLRGGGSSAALAIPATLHDSLMARIDRSSDYRGVVQMCAVLGREFDVETLQTLSGLAPTILGGVLEQLTESEIIFRTGPPNRRVYAFRHALVQDVAYESLLRSDRTVLHRKVGELLEQRLEDAPPDTDTSKLVRGLAYHWSRSVPEKRPDPVVVEKAVRHLTEAGERELMLSGYKEAAAHLEEAMRQLMRLPGGRRRDELELTVRTRISTVMKATVGPAAEEVRVELERCYQLCRSLGDRPELGAVLYSFWQLNLFRALYPESLRYARLCLEEAERTADPDLLIQSYVALSNTFFWFCNLEEAEESCRKVLAEYDPAKHGHHALIYGMDPGVLALMFGTWVPQVTGRLKEAEQRHREVERLSQKLQHPLSMALALNTSCCYHVNQRDFEGARRAGQAMIDLARTHGMFVYEIIGIHFRGWGAAKAGDAAAVVDEVRSTYRNYVEHVGGLAQTYIALLAAGVFEEAGEIDEAISTLDRALAVAEADHCRELAYHTELIRHRGELLLAQGHDLQAETALQTALDFANQRGQPPFALRAAVGLLRVAERQGRGVDVARSLIRAQLDTFGADETGAELEMARALAGGFEPADRTPAISPHARETR